MLGYDRQSVVTATVTAAATVSDPVDISGWNHVAFEIPTFAAYCVSATANVYLQGASVVSYASASTGTYRRVVDVGLYSASSGLQDWEVPETIGNRVVMCRPATRLNFIKLELSITTTAAMNINVIRHM